MYDKNKIALQNSLQLHSDAGAGESRAPTYHRRNSKRSLRKVTHRKLRTVRRAGPSAASAQRAMIRGRSIGSP